MHNPTKKPFPIILTGFMLAALVTLIMLGNWQRDRLAWKEDLIQSIQSRMVAAALPIEAIEAQVRSNGDIAYIPVTLSGSFMHQNEQHYFATFSGASGYFVYTPLKLEGRDAYIFVNRGFVPFDRKDPQTRETGQVTGNVTINGLARTAFAEKPSSIALDNDLAKNIYYWQDLAAMKAQSGLDQSQEVLPFFVDADATPNPGILPIGGTTQLDLPNNHLQYMITWYGIALTLIGVYAAFIIQWWRKKTAP